MSLKHAAGAVLRPGPIPNPSHEILGIFVNPSDPPKKGQSMKKKNRRSAASRKRRPNGKKRTAKVVIPPLSNAQLVSLAKKAASLSAKQLASDIKKMRRRRNPATGPAAHAAFFPAGLTGKEKGITARSLERVRDARRLGYGRRGRERTMPFFGGSQTPGEARRDAILELQEERDALEQAIAEAAGTPEEAVLREELDALDDSLSLTDQVLLTQFGTTLRDKQVERRAKEAERAVTRQKPLKRLADKRRKAALATILSASDNPVQTAFALFRIYGVDEVGDPSKIYLPVSAGTAQLSVDTAIAETTKSPLGYSRSGGNATDVGLLMVAPDLLQDAIEILQTELAPIPGAMGGNERRWAVEYRKLLARLKAAQSDRILNPRRKRGRRRNPPGTPRIDNGRKRKKAKRGRRRNPPGTPRIDNGRKRKKAKRGRRRNPQMGYQIRSSNPRRRKRNPSESDFQLILQGGKAGWMALGKQVLAGTSGYLLSGFADALLSGDVHASLNVTKMLPDSLGKAKAMIASALAATLSGVAVWGGGKVSDAVKDNAPGLFVGIGLRFLRNLLDVSTRGVASLQGLRTFADLPALGNYGCGSWNPQMNGYYNFAPVMGGYYNYQPSVGGYYNYAPALSGPPQMGYELSGLVSKNPFGEPF